ncbi:MAG: ATP--guanido phosphotransferase [Clostridia bacterium]|nr:ATP--guanido phosphotransferase [Clostridia bacterium]
MAQAPEFIETIVISTRIRLARNFAAYPFPLTMSDAHAEDVAHLVGEELRKLDEFTRYDIEKLDRQEALFLQEQYLISPLLMKSKKGAVFVSADKTISVMVNEEDHLREQYIYKGFDLYKAYERISGIDEGLGAALDFAFDEKFGYLTACPSNLGTGMRASVMMFLPGLAWNGELKKFLPTLKAGGLTVRGAFGEGTRAEGYIYQISNERTLGLSERDILEQMLGMTMTLCDLELRAREEMKKETEIRDRCLRAYGLLTNCAILSLQEFLSGIADVKLGLSLGYFKARDKKGFDEFINDMRPVAFRKSNGLEDASERACDEARAETVCNVLPELVRVIGKRTR